MSSLVNDNRGTRIVQGLVPALYDKMTVEYPTTTSEIYRYYYQNTQIARVLLIKTVSGDTLSAERVATD